MYMHSGVKCSLLSLAFGHINVLNFSFCSVVFSLFVSTFKVILRKTEKSFNPSLLENSFHLILHNQSCKAGHGRQATSGHVIVY